jgi:hypothetical protein
MATTLLDEIEHGAASDELSLGSLLRKCLILASRLGSRPAEDWVDWELNGYPTNKALPDYRVLHLTVKANMINMVQQVTDWTVPPTLLGDNAHKWTRRECRDGVGTLEHLLRGGDRTLGFDMGDLPLLLNKHKALTMDVISAWGEVDASQVRQILETVRNRVLRFALELSKEYPEAGSVRSTVPQMTDKANQIFINNIYGPANVVGNAHNSSVTLSIVPGNFDTVRRALVASGMSRADIDELEEVLKAEPEALPRAFGPKVSAWIDSMLNKAADGIWLIGTSAAGDVLSRILSKYYGLD